MGDIRDGLNVPKGHAEGRTAAQTCVLRAHIHTQIRANKRTHTHREREREMFGLH